MKRKSIYFNVCYSIRGFLSIDIDISGLRVNQCENEHQNSPDYISISETQPTTNNVYQHNFRNKWHWQTDDALTIDTFRNTHKCHQISMKVIFRVHNDDDDDVDVNNIFNGVILKFPINFL